MIVGTKVSQKLKYLFNLTTSLGPYQSKYYCQGTRWRPFPQVYFVYILGASIYHVLRGLWFDEKSRQWDLSQLVYKRFC